MTKKEYRPSTVFEIKDSSITSISNFSNNAIKDSQESYKLFGTNTPYDAMHRLVSDRVIVGEAFSIDRPHAKSLVYASNASSQFQVGLCSTKGSNKTNVILDTKGMKTWTEEEKLIIQSEYVAMVSVAIAYLESIGCRVITSISNSGLLNDLVGFGVFFSLINDAGAVKLIGKFSDELYSDGVRLSFSYIGGDTKYVEHAIFNLGLEAVLASKSLTLTAALGVDTAGELVLSKPERVGKSTIRLGVDLFYPFMTEYGSLNEYFDEFSESKQPVLILIGPPGTGNSTFVRTMAAYKSQSVLSVSREDAMNSVGFMTNFLKGDWDVLLVEDAEQFIKPRSEGNKLMSDILNTTDGIDGAGNKKIIFTTNLPDKNSIDEALMREGRCFDVLDFPLLSPSEATLIQDKYILDKELHQDLTSKRDWSLAQVLNPPAKRKRKVRQKQTFGFTST